MAALLAVTTPAQAVASLSSRICIICTILRTPKRTNPNRCSAVSSISCIFCMKSLTVWNRHTFSHGDLMTANRLARWAGVGALFGLVCPLARAANAAAAANTVAINFVWTLVTGFLVMFMQAGFAMVETGFTRAKNAAHTFAMNFMVYGIGMLAYWAVGFALQAGGLGPMATLGGFDKLNQEFSLHIAGKTWGLFGHSGFFLTGVAYAAPVFTYFLFQMVFMDTAATIPTGAMAERWKFSAFAVFSVFVGAFIYPLFANWTWGGGWLSQLGVNLGLGHGHV